MNEQDELTYRISRRAHLLFDAATEDLLNGAEWTKSERHDFYTSLADQMTEEITQVFALVRADERKRIQEALLSDEALQRASANVVDGWLYKRDGGDTTVAAMEAALAAIGITVEDDQP